VIFQPLLDGKGLSSGLQKLLPSCRTDFDTPPRTEADFNNDNALPVPYLLYAVTHVFKNKRVKKGSSLFLNALFLKTFPAI